MGLTNYLKVKKAGLVLKIHSMREAGVPKVEIDKYRAELEKINKKLREAGLSFKEQSVGDSLEISKKPKGAGKEGNYFSNRLNDIKKTIKEKKIIENPFKFGFD